MFESRDIKQKATDAGEHENGGRNPNNVLEHWRVNHIVNIPVAFRQENETKTRPNRLHAKCKSPFHSFHSEYSQFNCVVSPLFFYFLFFLFSSPLRREKHLATLLFFGLCSSALSKIMNIGVLVITDKVVPDKQGAEHRRLSTLTVSSFTYSIHGASTCL